MKVRDIIKQLIDKAESLDEEIIVYEKLTGLVSESISINRGVISGDLYIDVKLKCQD